MTDFQTRLTNQAQAEDCTLHFHRELYPDKQDCLWYGGNILTVMKDGYKYHLHAHGDVCATLYRRPKGSHDDGEIVLDVRDKNNEGVFGLELKSFIASDEELYKMTDSTTDGVLSKDGFEYVLQLENNNWWEVFVTSPDGKWHDLQWDLLSEKLEDTLTELLADIPYINEEVHLLSEKSEDALVELLADIPYINKEVNK